MAHVPDKLVNKFRKFVHDTLATIGVLALICVIGFYSQDMIGKSVLSGLITLVAFWAAAQIKYEYRLESGVAVYR